MKKFSGKKFCLHYAFNVDCPNYCKPVMKGGHRHNHIYNVCNRILFRSKNRRKICIKNKREWRETFELQAFGRMNQFCVVQFLDILKKGKLFKQIKSWRSKKMKTLTLSMKRKWFDMIKSGEKKEEYREFNEFWIKRLTWTNRYTKEQRNQINGTILFDRLVFTLGYPKADDTERRLYFKNPKIRIGEGRPEWGAKPRKQYFVITWSE